MLSKIVSNVGSRIGTFLAVLKAIFGNCMKFPEIAFELRWMQSTFMTLLKATFGICYRMFLEIASIQNGFIAHGRDTSLSARWVDLMFLYSEI